MTTYQNPVWRGYFADPFVMRVPNEQTGDGLWFYAYGTGATEAEGRAGIAGTPRAFPVLRSRDLAAWEYVGGALELLPDMPGATYWAPEVAYRDGTYYMYYSAGVGNSTGAAHEQHRLRVARAENPAGPFRDCGTYLFPDLPFSIDAHPFCDPADGQWYLFFAQDYFDGRVGTGTAVVRLADDMIHTSGEIVPAIRASNDWQIHARDRSNYGKIWDAWHTVEGAFVVLRDGLYYCFYSGGAWTGPDYGVGYGVAEHPLGPWRDGAAAGASVLTGVPGKVLGPGHNSVVLGADGATQYVCYHAWDVARTARRLCIDPLAWVPDGAGGVAPRCLGPTTEPQPIPRTDTAPTHP